MSSSPNCPMSAGYFKAVLFDLDGTLLDTEALSDKANIKVLEPWLPDSVKQELASHGNRLPWEIKKKILGLRSSSWVPLLTSFAKESWGINCPLSVEDFGLAWEANLDTFCKEILACHGANQLVASFSRAGLTMAIATSSRKASVDQKRKRHEEIFRHMSTVVCGDDEELENGKPAPDIYLLAARRLGVSPRECLVFEDAMAGVQSGKAAGCVVVAVPDPRFSLEEKAEFESAADVVLNDLSEFDGSIFAATTTTTTTSS